MPRMEIMLTLTQQVNKTLPLEIQHVFQAYMVAAKNIRNKAVFTISNIQSSYRYDSSNRQFTLKSNLHPNQQSIITIANLMINQLNQHKVNNDNNSKKVRKNNNNKLLKPFDSIIDKATYYQSMNKTLVENIIKYQEKHSQFKDYTIVNSVLAQNAVHKVCDDFQHYIKAMVAYYKNPLSFTGKPAKPSYKKELTSFEVASSRFNQNGSILGINKNHKLFLDFNKNKPTLPSDIIFYNNYNIKAVIEHDLATKPIAKKYAHIKITSLRVIPIVGKKANFKLEYTIQFAHALGNHYLAIFNSDPTKLKEADKYKLAKSYFNSQAYADNNGHQSLPHVAGIDLGHVNVSSIYYFTGVNNIGNNQADIVSGKNFIARVKKLDSKLDKLKQSYYDKANHSDNRVHGILEKLATNRAIKEFNHSLEDQSKTNPARKVKLEISLAEHQLLDEISKEIYKDSRYVKFMIAKNNITHDYMHKLSKEIVDNLVHKDIKLLVIGKNTGWKDGINMGKKNNRQGMNIPHNQLIELIKYKCILKNILVVEQEESYTSKKSFAENEAMPIYGKAVKSPVLSQGNKSQIVRQGHKLLKKVNNSYKLLCHADINGAMNIIRKFIAAFNIETIQKAVKQNKVVNGLQDLYDYRVVKLLNYKINGQALA